MDLYREKYKKAIEVIKPLYQKISANNSYVSQNTYLTNIFEEAFPELKEEKEYEKMEAKYRRFCQYASQYL